MIKTSMFAAVAVALSATGAVAQSTTSTSSTIVDEYGRHYDARGNQIYARGKAPTSWDRSWRTTTVPSEPSEAVMAPSPGVHAGSIVDEYGRHYNERGDRIR